MKPIYTLGTILLLVGVVYCPAKAKPDFYNVFRRTYSVKPGSPLDQARCLTCHTAPGPPIRNPFGKTVKAALDAAHSKSLTPSILRQLEGADADKDGWKNGEEIAAGFLPGDPHSHPTGQPSAKPSGSPPASPPANKSELIPTHSFHPLRVHFPIALFLFGVFLEGWGKWKRRAALREAGFVCLTGASVVSFAAVATGLIARYRLGLPFSGTVLIHVVLALSATFGMAATALLGRSAAKAGRERTGWLYWVVLLLSALLLGCAAFFGGILVYG